MQTDPRRFGAVLWHGAGDCPISAHPLLAKLGIEPCDELVTPEYMHKNLQGKTLAIKQALLAGHIVVGVGNIYASEELFRALLNPRTPAGSVSLARCNALSAPRRQMFGVAPEWGGSTLLDYVHSTGWQGSQVNVHAAVVEKAPDRNSR